MECNRYIPKTQLTMGNYKMTDDFFTFDVPDASVVLGFKWFYYIGKYTIDHQNMEMEFNSPIYGRKLVLRAMHKYPPKPVSSIDMELLLI